MANIPDWSDKTILVIEDEEVNLFFFRTALKVTNVNLVFAENATKGINYVLENNKIDCILMDIRLPGIDGYEATKFIKKERSDIPIIVETAYALSGERLKAFESGCDEYLSKPIKIDTLIEVLKKYL